MGPNRSKIGPKSSQDRPKIGLKSIRNRTKVSPGANFAPGAVLGMILTPFWTQLGAILGTNIGPCWGHVDQKIDFLRLKKASENRHDLQHLSGPSRERSWADFGIQNRPKVGPESVSRAIKRHSRSSSISSRILDEIEDAGG